MTDTPTLAVTAADRKRMLDRLAITGGLHLAPLINALDHAAVLIIPAGKLRFDAPKRGNWIALIGDDLLFAEGPSVFHLRSLRKLVERASAAYVMAGPVVADAYAAAADIAEAGANVVVVETQDSEQSSWMDFLHRHAPRAAVISLVNPTAKRKAA